MGFCFVVVALARWPWEIVRVRGVSMWPSLSHGDLAIVETLRRPVRVGDVVVFKRRKLLWVKRVARAESGMLFVLGDNLGVSCDSRGIGPVRRDAVVGRVVWSLRDPGWTLGRNVRWGG